MNHKIGWLRRNVLAWALGIDPCHVEHFCQQITTGIGLRREGNSSGLRLVRSAPVPELIEQLGGSAALGRAIGKAPSTVSEMKRRGSIPVEYWPAVRSEAERLGVTVTYDRLVEIHTGAKEVTS